MRTIFILGLFCLITTPLGAVPSAACPAECEFDFTYESFRCGHYYVLTIACQVQMANFCVEEFCVIYDAEETQEAAVDEPRCPKRETPSLEVVSVEAWPQLS